MKLWAVVLTSGHKQIVSTDHMCQVLELRKVYLHLVTVTVTVQTRGSQVTATGTQDVNSRDL